jgi:poly(A)-specific ribonuclease
VKSTVLGDLYESVTKSDMENCPLIVFGREFDLYATSAVHEAGFDAYLTGVSFLRLLGRDQDMKKSEKVEISRKYENRVFVMASCMHYFSLTSPDTVDYSNIFKLSEFPAKWKMGDIQQTFKDLGHFHVKWIDDQSCLLVLKKEAISLALGITQKKQKQYKFEQLEMGKKRKREETFDNRSHKRSKCIIQ